MSHGIIHSRSQGLIDFAYEFAKEAHGEQKRKYTGEPYINHPVEVAQIVSDVTEDCEMICAALLHDVIEDCGVTWSDLMHEGFGAGIACMVNMLSDISRPNDGNRAARKAIDRVHIAGGSPRAHTVKLADLISNTASITKYDPGFAKVYMNEKSLLLPILRDGDAVLWERANSLVLEYYNEVT